MNYEQFTMNNEPQSTIHQSSKDGEPACTEQGRSVEPFSNSLIRFAFGGVNLGNIYLSNQFNLGNLWQKINQSKHINYAKRTQFRTKSNFYNPNSSNELQRKNEIGHLVKTNPNEPNFKRHTCPVPRTPNGGQATRGKVFLLDKIGW